jgi:serine/threonine-protein kinase
MQSTGGELNLTQSGVTMGTPLYMAPEQAEGKPLDCRADIYSFGVTCYHMFAGEPPFRGATAVEVALQHICGQAPPLANARPDLPPALCTLVHRMMARKPEDRFQTARDVLREIARLREGMTGAVPLPPSMSSVDVVQVTTEGSSSVLLHTAASAPTVAASDMPVRPGRKRWLVAAFFVLSLVVAGVAGAVIARARHGATPTVSRGASTENIDPELIPLDDEQAQRRTADIYLAAGPGKDVSVGMSLCLKLALLYLEQHRLEDAEKLFVRLDNMEKVQSYHVFGRVGRAIVLALQDNATESNKLFREVAYWLPHRELVVPKGGPRRPDAELVKVCQNPSFLYWLAQAVRYNHINGVADDQVPPTLHRLLELKPRT